jgi:hypothetical protein
MFSKYRVESFALEISPVTWNFLLLQETILIAARAIAAIEKIFDIFISVAFSCYALQKYCKSAEIQKIYSFFISKFSIL